MFNGLNIFFKLCIKYLWLCLICLLLNTHLYAEQPIKFNPQNNHHKLYKPQGQGIFPAILLLHASTGVIKVDDDWAMQLKDRGYVVYIIDSFSPRGWKDRKSVGWEKATAAQLDDIVPAYQYLTHLPYVDPERIGIVGFSMGGFNVLKIREATKTKEPYQDLFFSIAVSFYGVCNRLPTTATIIGPTAIFVGAKDDRARVDDCIRLVNDSKKPNNPVFIRVYQDALHGFDNFNFPPNASVTDERGEQYHVGYNAETRKLAVNDLFRILDRYLK